MIEKILIANRGEIAVRIIRACRELGISPIAIYSEVDAAGLHVLLADEAYNVGPAEAAQSYLKIESILEVARRCGAHAIHPGYGFLAESSKFARAVENAGMCWIGPPPDVIDLMGSKTNARKAAAQSGVPIIPGTVDAVSSADEARASAFSIGYPLMLKAAGGGGGKGMRVVTSAENFNSLFGLAQNEALAAFGDPGLYLEKIVEHPRHIEIQVFGDTDGHVVHLGERECSIQRRYQKVVEECPSPISDPILRQRMAEAAVNITRNVEYVGAGTVEFLVSDTTREFYFLEMNTRLQVEHPVTEMVTGIDLVREQIMVAAGQPLSFTQPGVSWSGHAIECRIYAEDSEQNFLPSPGRITKLRSPSGPWVRNDSGVYEGIEISAYYDPLIAKLSVWGRTRAEATDRMRRALDEYWVTGIKTTLPFFRRVIRDADFIAGRLDTGFIERFKERHGTLGWVPEVEGERDIALIAAALETSQTKVSSPRAPASMWKLYGRLNLGNRYFG